MALTVIATVIPERAGVAVDVATLTGDSVSVYSNTIPQGKLNVISNPDFATDTSFWQVYGATSATIVSSQLVVAVPGGTTQYDVQVVQNSPAETATYLIQFSAKATAPITINVVFGPVVQVPIDTVMRKYSVFITTTANPGNQLSFAIGGSATPWTLTLDNVTATTNAPGVTTATTKELGARFTVTAAGYITAIRFWKPIGDTQTSRTLSLWDVTTGTRLGSVVTANETATAQGWITGTLATMVPVATGKTYCVSYTSTAPGLWANAAASSSYPVTVGGKVTMTTGVNGVAGTHPTTLDATLNHMVDVLYYAAGTSTITAVTIGRQDPNGFQQLIRYGEAVPFVGGALHIEDYEAPLDVPVYYVVAQHTPPGSEVGTSNTVIIPSQGRTWLKDPSYPSRNLVVPVMTSVSPVRRSAHAGIFPILDRANPVVVTTTRAGPDTVIVLHTLTDEQRKAMVNILASGSVLLIQTGPAELGSFYIHIGDAIEDRIGLVQEPSRRWTLPVTVVDRPAGLANASTLDRSWRKVRTTYLTWADLIATGKTNQDLLDGGP